MEALNGTLVGETMPRSLWSFLPQAREHPILILAHVSRCNANRLAGTDTLDLVAAKINQSTDRLTGTGSQAHAWLQARHARTPSRRHNLVAEEACLHRPQQGEEQ